MCTPDWWKANLAQGHVWTHSRVDLLLEGVIDEVSDNQKAAGLAAEAATLELRLSEFEVEAVRPSSQVEAPSRRPA